MHRTRVIRYSIAGGVILLILIGMTFLAYRSVPTTLDGITQLQTATNGITDDPTKASAQFNSAHNTLIDALNEIKESGPLTLLSPLPPFRWIVHLNKAAVYLADAGATASQALADYKMPTKSTDINAQLSGQSSAFFSWYAAHPAAIAAIQTDLQEADTELSAVPSWIFFGKRDEFEKLAADVHEAATDLPQAQTFVSALQQETGAHDSDPHTFLVLFQNDAELRPTGGFIGSYGTLTASSGVIRTFTFGTDIYKIDRPYMESAKVTPPSELKTITDYWAFRDSTVGSGFLGDGAKSAQTFYAAETGKNVDSIVFLDSTILEDVLRITGPVTLPGTTTTVDADSISKILTQEVEQTYFLTAANKVTDEPKSIINQLIPVLIAKLQKTPGGLHTLLPALRDEVSRKSLQLWFSNPTTETAIASIMPADQPLPASDNWVKIVNTNLGGLKSSRSVAQTVTVTQSSSVLSDRLTQTIHITRQHTGSTTFPDGNNTNYTEVYLPSDAENITLPVGQGGTSLLPIGQQQELGPSYSAVVQPHVTPGNGWIKVGFWATTDVGATTSYTLSYTLPDTTQTSTTFNYIKQAGSSREALNVFGYTTPVTQNLTIKKY